MRKKQPRPTLRYVRKILGLTQVELGALCGVSGSLVAQLERAEVAGSAALRARIIELVAQEIGLERLVFSDRLADHGKDRAT